MWQEEQLKSLKAYESANKEKFSKQFSRINKEIEDYIRKNANNSAIAEELRILRKTVDPKATIENLMDDLGKMMQISFESIALNWMNFLKQRKKTWKRLNTRCSEEQMINIERSYLIHRFMQIPVLERCSRQ